MLDLLNIAQTEAKGGDLLKLISSLYKTSKLKPNGYPHAIVWEGGNFTKNINPVAHALTDAYALLGTIAAIDILGLPFFAVPMWSQIRHDKNLEPLGWFGNMPMTSIKWSTAGDAYVNDGKGSKVVVEKEIGLLQTVKERGFVICGVNANLPGFSAQDESGTWSGLDVDFCKAVAAAIFGDSTKVEYVGIKCCSKISNISVR